MGYCGTSARLRGGTNAAGFILALGLPFGLFLAPFFLDLPVAVDVASSDGAATEVVLAEPPVLTVGAIDEEVADVPDTRERAADDEAICDCP